MNKSIFSSKKVWAIILLILLIIIVIIFTNTNYNTNNPPPTPFDSSKQTDFKGIKPGTTNQENLNEILGTPKDSKNTGLQDLLSYASSNEYRDHEVITENGKVVFIKEIINEDNNINTETLINKYGNPQYTLYDQRPNSVFNLYVYTDLGLAYLGHEDKTILEIWYFIPMSLADFNYKWAPNYSLKQAENKSSY